MSGHIGILRLAILDADTTLVLRRLAVSQVSLRPGCRQAAEVLLQRKPDRCSLCNDRRDQSSDPLARKIPTLAEREGQPGAADWAAQPGCGQAGALPAGERRALALARANLWLGN